MFYKYRKSYNKVAIGLLSLMAKGLNFKLLQETIRMYEENPERQLFLWKEGDNITGLAGVEQHEEYFIILHFSVNPSYQKEETAYRMLEVLREQMHSKEMHLSKEAARFIAKVRGTSDLPIPIYSEPAIS
ncbi:GNAT family N-acetyltransferase [Planococcus liqunii]|uniref:GNAT family N-acetyltransferase n=1 Tax=Planococcus liqunii TaxID=3058394 RepID=A0ABT8MQM8_9BACL|nr:MULTISPECIES: GNAT family N-acetyltransferase [unclassified Planococcus (in: firmicutes)]MDN7227080.1 GNAT family N-acetyltransferase [Planococcus sp. N064]WKA52338.1 GNAT family N-acetyltransferase [Planococcus sp. N056]